MKHRTSFIHGYSAALSVIVLLSACGVREEILPGPREPIRPGAQIELSPDTPKLGQPRAISLAAERNLSAWTNSGGSPSHATPHLSFSRSPELLFRVPIGAGNSQRYRITTTPIAANGRIFVMDARGSLSALNVNGELLWSRKLTRSLDSPQLSSASLAFGSGRLFVSSGLGVLLAFNPRSGELVWRQEVPGNSGATPMVHDGILYLASRDGRGLALDAATGKVRWGLNSAPSRAHLTGGPAPALSGDQVIFPFGSGQLVSVFRRGGLERWRNAVTGGRTGSAASRFSEVMDPVVLGSRVYAANHSGRIVAFDRTEGERLWTARSGALGPLRPAGNSLFFISDGNRLTRIEQASGGLIWSVQLPNFVENNPRRQSERFRHYGPLIAGGLAWVASSDGVLRGFDPESGDLIQTAPIQDGAASQPIIVDGVMYIINRSGFLLGYR